MEKKLEEQKIKETNELRKKRRKNANLYPTYKMISWDLLFFYSIEFLFFTITKKVTASEILIINGFFYLFKTFGQIIAVAIIDYIGKKKSIVLGNLLYMSCIISLILIPGAWSILVANFFFAIGDAIKSIAESNLLYDSVATKGGDGLFSKLDAKGGSYYYILDGIASMLAGYLFVINNYLPMFICLGFIVVSTIMSTRFEEIYDTRRPRNKKKNKNRFKLDIKTYIKDLRVALRFMLKSKRMKALVLFQIVFYSLIAIMETFSGDLLVDIGIPEAQFSMIFAILTLIGGISLVFKKNIEKKFKNRTLAFLSLSHIISCILIGVVSSFYTNSLVVPLILIMLAIQKISSSTYYVLESKYLKNFTTVDMRNKLTFSYEFVGGIASSICSVLGGILLSAVNIENAFLIVGLVALLFIIITLDYMKPRIGLKPEEYKKSDVEF